ncbi:MAG: tetratricopeptide repeat protein [Terracidiphilus sp.]|nr:tetratricopeptide repeat protein [Terracidiphilus sp.]MDR3799565.1 tetratricopeptide repeat protein [Terracidiphilus sp.]
MRRTLFVAATILSAFLLAVPARPQDAKTGAQSTPQALKATYDQAMQAKDWLAAIAAAQQLVDANATSANLLLLANAQLNAASAHSDTGPMETALATYDRALAAAQQEKPVEGQPDSAWKDGVSKIYIGKGNALLKLKRNADAIDSYNRAAELSSNSGQAYFNVCAVSYNIGETTAAVTACRKSVQADPTRANAWFVLGSSLFADAQVSSIGKVTITAETRQALEKYLALAPDGPHAADVKAMLDMVAK